ncbi:tkl protein kinase [Plasmopara halstedii]|uniref:Tkl protein kinase n=1 Tax=Plasmopara halstedii TaxID=4781 RepID=A0A0P1A6U5_PLAHL|nr:tkl protein kinase [Plasmopara halstedii]CEG36344.1 tkl protein kinase [Plasmopara halstedii]|eukprot:XP_024572713.1 tkl protein kinase [Plasmopara halstedii]
MASASRRRSNLGDHRKFFQLCGSPIRTHKMKLDFNHGRAHSPTLSRPVELVADIDTLLVHRRPSENNYKQKQRQAEANAAMITLANQLGREGGGYYAISRRHQGLGCNPIDVGSNASMSCAAEEGSNDSLRLEGARKAGIPLYLSDWFAHNTNSNRRRQTNVNMEPEAESAATDCCENNENQFLKPHQNVDMADVIVGRVIGEGAFGKVFKASWNGRDVAVKVLIRQNLSADVNRALVIELVEQGSLWAILRTRRRQLTDKMRARFVLDTARGMSYLHKFELPILHRDMKSPNLLVERDYSIKISDFGLSRVKAQIQTMTGNCGTVQWMAPEVLGNRKYTEKADVFSFGVVIWEIFTGQCPYDGMTQIQVALGVLNHDLRPPIPRSCPRFFAKLIRSCWMREPTLRPSFSELISFLPSEPIRAVSAAFEECKFEVGEEGVRNINCACR